MATFYISELDNRPVEWDRRWLPTKAKAIEAARQVVAAAKEPVFIAVVDATRVVHRVARADHPDAEYADEILEVTAKIS